MNMPRTRTMHEENQANMAALDQRVLGLEGDVQALRQDLSSGLSNLRTDFIASFNQINAKLDRRDDRRWVWPVAIGAGTLVLAIVVALGALSLGPLREDVIRLRADLAAADRNKADGDRRQWDYYGRLRSEFDYMRGQLSPLRPP